MEYIQVYSIEASGALPTNTETKDQQSNDYITIYDRAYLDDVRVGEQEADGGREFHTMTDCIRSK